MLGIISVVLDDRQGLQSTLASIRPLGDLVDEVIVQDGSRRAVATREEVMEWSGCRCVVYVNARDEGPYDAMNRGLDVVSSNYVWFLNAGDLAGSPAAFQAVVESFFNRPALIVGAWQTGKNKRGRGLTSKNFLRRLKYTWGARHQSVLFYRPCLKDIKYCLKYKICADRRFMLDVVRNKGQGCVKCLPEVLSINDEQGISQRKIIRKELENLRITLSEKRVGWVVVGFGRFVFRCAAFVLVGR